MEKKKLFISQPMRGRTDKEILAQREDAITKARELFNEEVVILDSYFRDYTPSTDNIALEYLGESLKLLAQADVVYFAKGWSSARGCIIEHHCAVEYGIKIIF